MCRQRLARVLLFGCLLTVLAGGAPLVRPAAAQAGGQSFHAQAAHAAPALGRAVPLSSRQHDGDDDDKGDKGIKGVKCSVAGLNCDALQQQQCSVAVFNCDQLQQQCLGQAPIVRVVEVPVVKVVRVVQVVEKKVFVPVTVVKEVKVFVPVEKEVKVFVPVPVVVTPTPGGRDFVPVAPPAAPTQQVGKVFVPVAPPATPRPTPPGGDPMF